MAHAHPRDTRPQPAPAEAATAVDPVCGMALEPKGVPPADAGPSPELVDFSRRLKVGAALTVPLLALAMGPDLGLPLHRWISPRVAGCTVW